MGKYTEQLKDMDTDEIFRVFNAKHGFEQWISDALEELKSRFPKFRNPLPVVVVLIPDEDGCLLLVRRTDSGLLALPGGYQNFGETWQEAAIREVKEETGLTIWQPELIDVVTIDGHNLLFCKVQPKVIDLTLPHDSEVTEMALRQNVLPEEVAFPSHYKMISEYLEGWI
jgi:hypothetical protein